jgi:hypothetical protein
MLTDTRDDRPPPPPEDLPADPAPPGAGALYRQHLERFPERGADSALERAARALIRAAQLRLRAPRKAN